MYKLYFVDYVMTKDPTRADAYPEMKESSYCLEILSINTRPTSTAQLGKLRG